MKFTVCYSVLNEERFLPYSLKSTYSFADEIIILEGARGSWWWSHANSDGSSVDGTVQVIKNFSDPQNKIRLHQGKWKDKLTMKNELLQHATGDWILLCAADEVYDSAELELLKSFVLKHQNAVCVKFPFIHFIWNENYQIITRRPQRNMRDWRSRHQRFFKNMPGLRYKSSHSDVEDQHGKLLIHYGNDKVLWFPQVHVYHYGYCRSPEKIRRKLMFYCERDNAHRKHGFTTMEAYVKDHPYFSREGDVRMGEKIVRFKGRKLGVDTGIEYPKLKRQ